jgi:probable phosphoglycerate mutase
MSTVFYLVRHGESEGNVNQEIMGGNPPLTENGRQQAREAAERFKDVNFDLAFSSDLDRAIETAALILQGRNLPVQHLPRLRERNWGELELAPIAHVREKYKSHFDAFPTQTPEEQWSGKLIEGMESPREAVDRLLSFLEEISNEFPGKTILVVNHGALMRTLLVHLGEGTFMNFPAGSVKNAGVIKLLKTKEGFSVLATEKVTKATTPA